MFKIKCYGCKHESEVTDHGMKHMIEEDEIVCPNCNSLDVYILEYPEGLSDSSTIDEIEEYLGIE